MSETAISVMKVAVVELDEAMGAFVGGREVPGLTKHAAFGDCKA